MARFVALNPLSALIALCAWGLRLGRIREAAEHVLEKILVGRKQSVNSSGAAPGDAALLSQIGVTFMNGDLTAAAA